MPHTSLAFGLALALGSGTGSPESSFSSGMGCTSHARCSTRQRLRHLRLRLLATSHASLSYRTSGNKSPVRDAKAPARRHPATSHKGKPVSFVRNGGPRNAHEAPRHADH